MRYWESWWHLVATNWFTAGWKWLKDWSLKIVREPSGASISPCVMFGVFAAIQSCRASPVGFRSQLLVRQWLQLQSAIVLFEVVIDGRFASSLEFIAGLQLKLRWACRWIVDKMWALQCPLFLKVKSVSACYSRRVHSCSSIKVSDLASTLLYQFNPRITLSWGGHTEVMVRMHRRMALRSCHQILYAHDSSMLV